MVIASALAAFLYSNLQAIEPKEELVKQFIAKEGAVGVSVAIVDKSFYWTCQAGFASREQKRPVNKNTLFRLGSISKPIAATLAMSLVQQGKLDLDKGISAYAAGYPDHNGTITLRRVLCHTSGIRHYTKDVDDVFYEPMSTKESLDRIKNDALLFEPGEKYSYSTHAYTLVVAAVESASRKPYRDYLRTYISRRGQKSIDCEVIADAKSERTDLYSKASPQAKWEEKRQDISWKTGGGGLEATALDVARFGSSAASGRFLRPDALKAMWTKQKLNDGSFLGNGLGWDLSKDGFARHSGGQQGCSAYLLVDRKRHIGVAVMCNTEGMPVSKLAEDLYNAYLK